MSSRIRLFIENFFAYGLINAFNRIIPILLLPIVTRLLTDTADYGRFDMFNALVSFGSALAGLGVYDAMFREFFEKESPEYKRTVTSNALYIVLCSSFLVAGVLILFKESFALAFLGSRIYTSIIVFAGIGIIIGTLRLVVAAPTRMQNKRKIYIYSGVLNSTLYYALAIALILRGHTYLSLITSNLISGFLLLLFFFILNHRYFSLRLSDKKVRSELYKIGIPLMPTLIIYWVFHSVDKIMITHMIGLGAVGIYSVGSRVASISNFIYAAFSGGFSYFKFSTMKDEDQVIMNSRLFDYLGLIVIISFICVVPFFKLLFEILFTGDYVLGYTVAPYLFLAPLLLMLFQIVGSQFIVSKQSYLVTLSLTIGALLNVVLNYFLIRRMGIEGVAAATLIGYCVSLVSVILLARFFKLAFISKKIYFGSVIMLIHFFIIREFGDLNYLITGSATIVAIILILFLYRSELTLLIRRVKNIQS